MLRVLVALSIAAIAGCSGTTRATTTPSHIVLVGGAPSEGPGRHAYPDGIRTIEALLDASPDRAARGDVVVDAYPDGWPADPRAFDHASTVVWYFDGLDRHPLRDPARRAQFDMLMRRGVGLVALHQASTVPPGGDDFGLVESLGGVRDGTRDRTTETARLDPVARTHPVSRGLASFDHRDEFYPTLRFARDAKVTPILDGVLHVQYRDGRSLVEETAEKRVVAWTYERDGGGRAFAFTGAHFVAALDRPEVRTLLLNAIFWTAGMDVPAGGVRTTLPSVTGAPPAESPDAGRVDRNVTTFHHDAGRSSWFDTETTLTRESVRGPTFGSVWESPPFEAFDGQAARLYASPLYVDRVTMSAGPYRGVTFAIVLAASSNGDVYAVNARANGDIAPGRILWHTRLDAPCRLQPAPLDGVPTGILGTPVVDVARQRVYVAHCDPTQRWQAYALDLTSGRLQAGWPVRLDEETFDAANANAGPSRVAPSRRFDFRVQRGALNLSPDGAFLYVTFGETETGWLVAVDTRTREVASTFATVAMPRRGSGGLWGAGGASVDADGRVFVATGTGYEGYADRPHDWTQSLLMLSPPDRGAFTLLGTWTPFNHCVTAANDIDLGSGGVALLPARRGDAPLLAIGGKQGNVYLLDRTRLPGRLDRRPACTADAATDASLLPPDLQPQWGTRGPLNVFGPYSEKDAALDLARARSVPAFFRDAQEVEHLYVTGTTKDREGSDASVPPSVVKLDVVRGAGTAHLRVSATERLHALKNPGSPVVTSNGARDAIVWVLDENARRSAPLTGPDAPRPVLYAFDADSLALLWKSDPGALFTSGKYNEPTIADGQVFVGTDRIQAFGPGKKTVARAISPESNTGAIGVPAAPQRAPLGAEALYRTRCAACHDAPEGNVPPRALLATRPHIRIVDALTRGAMRPYAQGLTGEEIDRLATYLR